MVKCVVVKRVVWFKINEEIPDVLTVKASPVSFFVQGTENPSPYSGNFPQQKMCTSSAAAMPVILPVSKLICETLSF